MQPFLLVFILNKKYFFKQNIVKKIKIVNIFQILVFLRKKKNSKSHFFYEYFREYETPDYFEETIVDLKIQQSSNDTYLKANKLESNLMPDSDVLENTFGLNLYSNDLSINDD